MDSLMAYAERDAEQTIRMWKAFNDRENAMADRELEAELKNVYEVLGRVVMENLDFKGQILRMEDRMLESETDTDESKRVSNINVRLADALQDIRLRLEAEPMPGRDILFRIVNNALNYSGRE